VAVQTPQVNVTIDRDKAAVMKRQRQPHRERPLRRLRAAVGLHHLWFGERIQGAAGAGAEVPGRSARPLAAVFQEQQWQTDSARHHGHVVTETGPQTSTITASFPRPPSPSTSSRARPWERWSNAFRSLPTASCRPPSAPNSKARPRPSRARSATCGPAHHRHRGGVHLLGILYESYIHPHILSGLPSAGFGALMTLLIFHIDLNIYALWASSC